MRDKRNDHSRTLAFSFGHVAVVVLSGRVGEAELGEFGKDVVRVLADTAHMGLVVRFTNTCYAPMDIDEASVSLTLIARDERTCYQCIDDSVGETCCQHHSTTGQAHRRWSCRKYSSMWWEVAGRLPIQHSNV